jgi:glycerol uptake facilitator-like aquaporin
MVYCLYILVLKEEYMATKKVTKKPAAARKSAPVKSSTTVRTIKTNDSAPRVTGQSSSRVSRIDNNVVNIVLAELVGTFTFVMVAMLTASEILPLFIGLTLVLLVMTIGAVSGSHVNPAVTFGLWASQRLKTILVPFYWGAQLLGGVAALVVTTAVSGTKLNIDFLSHFSYFSWTIFFIELIGTAVFLWGLTSVLRRTELTNGAKALGIGMSLFAGILIATSLYTPARTQAISDYQKKNTDAKEAATIPHSLYVSGATLNPAVALVTTEIPESQLKSSQTADNEVRFSRLGWEVILGTLIGAAIGANLTRLVNYRFRG